MGTNSKGAAFILKFLWYLYQLILRTFGCFMDDGLSGLLSSKRCYGCLYHLYRIYDICNFDIVYSRFNGRTFSFLARFAFTLVCYKKKGF